MQNICYPFSIQLHSSTNEQLATANEGTGVCPDSNQQGLKAGFIPMEERRAIKNETATLQNTDSSKKGEPEKFQPVNHIKPLGLFHISEIDR